MEVIETYTKVIRLNLDDIDETDDANVINKMLDLVKNPLQAIRKIVQDEINWSSSDDEVEVEIKRGKVAEDDEKKVTKKVKKKVKEDDKHGLLIFVDNVGDEQTRVCIYKRKNKSFYNKIDTRMILTDKDYLVYHLDELENIKRMRDDLIVKCKKNIPSFKFVKHTGGAHVVMNNDEFEKFEEILAGNFVPGGTSALEIK